MTLPKTVIRCFCITALMAGCFSVLSAEDSGRPAFIHGSLFPANQTVIADAHESVLADIIVLRSGLRENFRVGAFCVVERGGVAIAEVVIVDADRNRSIALITDISDEELRPGDRVRLRPATNR